MRTMRKLLLIALLCACDAAGGNEKDRIAATQEALPCGSLKEIEVLNASLTPEEQCTLARRAVNAVASGGGSVNGVAPADTVHFESAVILYMDFRDPQGATTRPVWAVSFGLRGRPYRAEVRLSSDRYEVVFIGRGA